VGDVGEARLRVHVNGAMIHRALAHESSGPDSDHPFEALARVLTAWQANQLSDYVHIWRGHDRQPCRSNRSMGDQAVLIPLWPGSWHEMRSTDCAW
jgi:hypothetical protein